MNLPNKLTILRVIMIPFFLDKMGGTWNIYCGCHHRYIRRPDRQTLPSCNKLWKVHGSSGRQAAGVFGTYCFYGSSQDAGLDRYSYNRKGIYHKRLQTYCCREGSSNSSRMVGKDKDNCPDDNGMLPYSKPFITVYILP